MCKMRDNLEKYSILDPTKQDRKIIKRRSTDNVEDDKDSVNQSSAPQKSQLNKKKKNVVKSVPHRKAGPSRTGSKSLETWKAKKRKVISDDTSSEEEDSTEKELVRKINCLQKENKQKSKDIKKQKRTMEDMLNDLTLAAALSKKVLDNLKSVDDYLMSANAKPHSKLKEKFETSDPKQNNVQNDIHDESFQMDFDKQENLSAELQKDNYNQNNGITKNGQLERTNNFEANNFKKNDDTNENDVHLNLQSQDQKESLKDKYNPNSFQVLEKRQKKVIDPKNNYVKEDIPIAVKEEIQSLGDTDITVSCKRLNMCNHTTATKLTTDLLSLMFTKKELATSSMTGKVGNMHMRKGTAAKMQLDVSKIAAINSYVKSKFPTVEKLQSVINKAIQQKCCNAAKSVKLIACNLNNMTPKE
ncbi:uncharacterized protein [Temnothorax longispinosus]|uniref:uncharacterized protein n=1 Tax=Temnothorax longispinosus TaxID=300112 RepID=UPI003A994031